MLQPTSLAAHVLAQRGIKVDSSVYKGGLSRQHKLDYRRALRNGYYWRFTNHADVPTHQGLLLELPIHTQMVAAWKMLTHKRIGLQRKGSSGVETSKDMMPRLLDFLRFRYPLKLDFCRMTLNELVHMVDAVIKDDHEDPRSFRPIVAIGHTKDLIDLATVEAFLSYLGDKGIAVSTFEKAYQRCK